MLMMLRIVSFLDILYKKCQELGMREIILI